MNSHVEWTPVVVAALVAWWTVVIAGGLVMRRPAANPVTLDVTQMSHRRTWLPAQRATLWRHLSWLAFVVGLDGASLRAARRAERIERRTRQRARAVARESARALDWDRTLASSPCSATILPPSAPRPPPVLPWISPDMNPSPPDEDTRRWERTLPWGTPSPLMTREGRAKPYPFVPLAPPLPTSSSRRARRNP
jgi:hypothetical protein